MAITKMNTDVFNRLLYDKYRGKIHRIVQTNDPKLSNVIKVHVEFHIPIAEADELEMYRRIHKVIHVIAEGEK